MKLYFGNKTILIDFLNDLFAGEKIIEDLVYLESEQDGEAEEDRRTIFDLNCKGGNGEYFIIEMQQFQQNFFIDRAIYYTSRLISKKVKKGKEGANYELPEVYFIAFLQFDLPEMHSPKYLRDIALFDKQTKELFYNKLGFKFIILPDFVKEGPELKSDRDQWLYLIKNLSRLEEFPDFLDKRIFGLINNIGKIAKLKKEDRVKYEAYLKNKLDQQSIINSARANALLEGKIETALEMNARGFENSLIAEILHLPIDEIEKIVKQNKEGVTNKKKN